MIPTPQGRAGVFTDFDRGSKYQRCVVFLKTMSRMAVVSVSVGQSLLLRLILAEETERCDDLALGTKCVLTK